MFDKEYLSQYPIYQSLLLEYLPCLIAFWVLLMLLNRYRGPANLVYKKNRQVETYHLPNSLEIPRLGTAGLMVLYFFLLYLIDQWGDSIWENIPLLFLVTGLVLFFWYQKPGFILKIKEKSLEFNRSSHQASAIKSLEFWDEVIVLQKETTVIEIPLVYHRNSFNQIKALLSSLKGFAQRQGIPIKDQFAYRETENEVLK